MKDITYSENRHLKAFFVLTFILALPAYILVGLTSRNILLSPEMAYAFVPLSALAPIGAALILTLKESGWGGVKRLLKRSFDHKRITNKGWYLPTLFLAPFLVLSALGIALLLGLPLVDALFPVVAAPVVFFLFFGGALGEEVGWMGYAYEPMMARWNAFTAALLLGLIIALWHVPLYYFLIADPVTLTATLFLPVVLRILLVWIFNNTGQSVFATILFHAMNNVAFAVLPVNAVVSTLTYTVAVIVVTILWGPETMAKFRWKKQTLETN